MTLGRRAQLTSSSASFAASSCSVPPWTPRTAHFEPRALCSLELLGDPWTPAPITLSRAPFVASSGSASPWTPRAAHFEPRAPCSLELLGDP